MRAGLLLFALAGVAPAVAVTAEGTARACGGCFIRPTQQVSTVVTDHRMIFAAWPGQTTLYDQIKYSGSPSDFAWVLPIHGQVDVGLSSDLLFATLDQQTQTTVLAPPYPCAACNCGLFLGQGAAANGSVSVPPKSSDVTVTSQEVVGPYATVQLHPNSTTDTTAVSSWLDVNGYSLPPGVEPIIAAYVAGGFDFLAIKLQPGQGVQAMRPISVTSPGAGLSLPLRMVAAGTGSTVGITLWVVSSGRYEPQNFPTFTIAASDLVWDWSTRGSNYATLVSQAETQQGNAVWQIESSIDSSAYTVSNPVLQDPTASAYAPIPAPDGGPGQTPLEARSHDIDTLFPQANATVRITRMRADLSQAALANDLVLQASADQSALSNVYQATKSINANCPACPCAAGDGSSCSTAPPPSRRTWPFAAAAAVAGALLLGARARRRRAQNA